MSMKLSAATVRAAAAVLPVLAAAVGVRADDGVERRPRPAPTVLEARIQAVDDIYAADAVIEAVRQATVAAQLSGVVVELLVDAGDRVKKGQVLARIDTRRPMPRLLRAVPESPRPTPSWSRRA